MASWMIHLSVADALLDRIPGLEATAFVMGNMVPDSGIPNEDWSAFTPGSEVSHFRTTDENGIKLIHEDWYIKQYFTQAQRGAYTAQQHSFYLGYLAHLLTDKLWARDIVYPLRERDVEAYERDRNEWFRVMKQEWRMLDALFLKRHQDFRAFVIYEGARDFRNTYMSIFAEDAFERRRAFITAFCRQGAQNASGEPRFLSEAQLERFVRNTANEIVKTLEG